MPILLKRPSLPSDDKRWKLIDVAMRRHGYAGHSLIQTLHAVQECFGYLDDTALRFVALSLGLPTSKVYGVATFYNLFTLKPPGRHTCVVCTGTACYIKGSDETLRVIRRRTGLEPGQTTEDDRLSLVSVHCIGACGLAPVSMIDGKVISRTTPDELVDRLEELV